MDHDRMAAMAEATALTRAGRLAEATDLIRRTVSGAPREPWPPDFGDRGNPPPSEPDGSPRDVTSECTGGGLRGLLREHLGRAARGAATHLRGHRVADPPWSPQHQPGPGLLGSAASALPDLQDLPRLLAGSLPAPGGLDLAGTSAPVPNLPGETSVHTHRNAAGARPYTLYVPTTGTNPRPLVVMLHGGTQTVADFATATRMSELAEEHGFLVAYPEQVTSANPMRYWNWFQPGDQQRGAGEPAILAGIVAEIADAHAVDRDRVYVAGFSAGAAMAAVLGAAYPDVFAAVGVHSGLPHGCAHDVASALAAMRAGPVARPLDRAVPVIAFHGDADPTVAPDNATRVVEQFTRGAVRGDTLVERGPGRPATRTVVRRDGVAVAERWTVHGSGHAWSGGVAGGSYTDPTGPDASAEMIRFFAEHARRG